jgi:hypothetical protein
MHSVVDWSGYAIWTGDGALWRSVSLSSDSGVIENLGTPLTFEAPYRAGEKPVDVDDSSWTHAERPAALSSTGRLRPCHLRSPFTDDITGHHRCRPHCR